MFLFACGGGEAPKATAPPPAPVAAPTPAPAPAAPAVGPEGPSNLKVPAITSVATDAEAIKRGDAVFQAKGCGGCHAWGSKLVGPDLTGVLKRRDVAWVEKMILYPDEMVKQDPAAKELFKTHMVQMPKQGVSDTELPDLLAFIQSK